MFIPIINVFVILMFLFNVHNSPDSIKLFKKSILIFLVSSIIPIVFFENFMGALVDYKIVSYMEIYFVPLIISFSLICFQKKNMRQKGRQGTVSVKPNKSKTGRQGDGSLDS